MNYKGVSGLNGSYKLSETVIERILSRQFDGSDSVSNYEILALIYFSQICDIKGVIEEYKVPDLAEIIGCSRRATYYIVENLVIKGFIIQSKSSWAGYRKLTILNNDFSSADYKSVRYLNTNFSYFARKDPDYSEFKKLSLYAKKALLIILLKYHSKYGYRVEIDTLRSYLGVSKKEKIMEYIHELQAMFDERILIVSSNNKERIKNHNLRVVAKMPCFTPLSSIKEYQDCYTKFRIETLFKRSGITFNKLFENEFDIWSSGIQQIYSIYVNYASKGLSYSQIEEVVSDIILSFGYYDDLVRYNINQELNKLVRYIS